MENNPITLALIVNQLIIAVKSIKINIGEKITKINVLKSKIDSILKIKKSKSKSYRQEKITMKITEIKFSISVF